MLANTIGVLDEDRKEEPEDAEEVIEVTDEEAVLDSLPIPPGRSSHWLLDHEDVTSWMHTQQYKRKVIWLYGSPGSGKTVLLRDILIYLISQTFGNDGTSILRKPIYFFFDDKLISRNSSLDFVRSAIKQILGDKRMEPSTRYLSIRDCIQKLNHGSEDDCWKLFYTIIQRSRGVLYLFVIDAIDEVLRNVSVNTVTIIDRLQELLSMDLSGRVRLLVSDREKRVYGFRTEDIVTIEVDNEVTTSSVNEFVRMRLRRGFEMSNISPTAGKEAERKIIEIAQGNFLHANLLLEQFASGVQRWDRNQISQGLERLNTLSHDLATSYCRLLARIAQPYRRRTKAAFAVLRVCQETLTLRQLSFFATLYEALHTSPKQRRSLDVEDLMWQRIDFEDYARGALGYIIKEAADGIVSFAHVSVKDLFTKFSNPDLQLPEHAAVLKEFNTSEAEAHSILQNLCFNIFRLEDRSPADWINVLEEMESIGIDLRAESVKATKSSLEAISNTPCMAYAVAHCLGHFQQASTMAMADLDAVSVLHSPMGYVIYVLWMLLRHFSSSTPLIKAVKSHEPFLTHSPSSDVVLSRILARGDFPRLVQYLVAKGANANATLSIRLQGDPKENGASLLSWAVICQQQESFDLLLRYETTQVDFDSSHAPSPLHFAVEKPSRIYFVRKLIQHPQCKVNTLYNNPDSATYQSRQSQGTPLYLAYRAQNAEAVELLLAQPHIDIWIKGGSGESPYSMTFKYGTWRYLWGKMLELSGKTIENVLAENVSGISKIFSAGVYGWTDVEERILFENPRQLLAVDPETRMSPLTTYAYFGRRDKLLWILDRLPADFPLREETDEYDVLHLCAHHGWEDVVHLLRRRFGLRSLDSDHTGRTLLHWAIEHFWDMEQMDLADFGGSHNLLDKKDRDGLTALHLAVVARNMKAIEALTASGADCLLADKHGNTPAHLAADLGFRGALDFFIDRKEREFGRTRSGASLLHLISMWFDGATVRRFVHTKRALVNVVDKQRLTPLHYAAVANNLSAIDVLVDQGGGINARSASRTTPLHEAIRSGSVGAALLLLKLGADYHATDGFKQNCLHLSCRYGHDGLISRLLKLGCDTSIIDVFGMHLLHRACASDKAALALQLLEDHADWTSKDKYRRSMLDMAVQNQAVSATTAVAKWLHKYFPQSRTRWRLFDRALKIAYQENRSSEIKNLLRHYGARYDGKAASEARPEVERHAGDMQVVVWVASEEQPDDRERGGQDRRRKGPTEKEEEKDEKRRRKHRKKEASRRLHFFAGGT